MQLFITIISIFVLFYVINHSILIRKIIYQSRLSLSKPAIRAIGLLFFLSLFFFISGLNLFLPENIILKTSSAIQTPKSILLARLSYLRPITEYDQKLLQRLKILDGRLLYVLYGPSALVLCEWCEIKTPETFLYYTIPHILLYYLVNIGIIRLSTSIIFKGVWELWGKSASIITFFLFILELIVLNIYDWKSNAYISSLDIDWIHWKLNKYRSFLMIIIDLSVAFIIWLIDINVWHHIPNEKEQLIFSINNLEESINCIDTLVIMKRALVKDVTLQKQKMEFYQQEEKRLGELYKDMSIKNAGKNVVSQKNIEKKLEVENYVESLIEYLDMKQ